MDLLINEGLFTHVALLRTVSDRSFIECGDRMIQHRPSFSNHTNLRDSMNEVVGLLAILMDSQLHRTTGCVNRWFLLGG